MRHISKSHKDTKKVAETILRKIISNKKKNGATVVGLSGNLGAGKTAFVKAVAKHLGIKSTVNSPTFVIIKKYPIKGESFKYLFHLDAYRLKNEEELAKLGWNEIIKDSEHLVFIEWPENVKEAMPKGAKNIAISYGEDGHRHFKI